MINCDMLLDFRRDFQSNAHPTVLVGALRNNKTEALGRSTVRHEDRRCSDGHKLSWYRVDLTMVDIVGIYVYNIYIYM